MHFLACSNVGKDFAVSPYCSGGIVATAFYAQYCGMLHLALILFAAVLIIFVSIEKTAHKITQVFIAVPVIPFVDDRFDRCIAAQ
jgi:hypothetical protein